MVLSKLHTEELTMRQMIVTDEVTYMTADYEEGFYVAQANEPLNHDGSFVNKKIVTRYKDEFIEVPPERVDYMDVSPRQVSICSYSHDSVPRERRRQPCPDGFKHAASGGAAFGDLRRLSLVRVWNIKPLRDSGVCVLAKRDGTVSRVSATRIEVKDRRRR